MNKPKYTPPPSEDWFRDFFGSVDSLDLSLFPDNKETDQEVAGIIKLLNLQPDDLIADICCGYCRHSMRLVERGYRVIGLDLSEMMLACAGGISAQEGFVSVPVVRGDAAKLPFANASVDVVLNLFNSFGYFLDEGSNLAVIQEAARVLKPGGRFLLDTRNRQYQIIYAPHYQPYRTADGRDLILRCTYDRPNRRLDSRWSLPDDPKTIVHEASIRLYGIDELREWMALAGLEEMQICGDYNGNEFEGWQRQLLFIARKRNH